MPSLYLSRVLIFASSVKKVVGPYLKIHRFKCSAEVPSEVLHHKELSFAAKGLYGYLLSMEDPTHITIKGIAMHVRENEADIVQAAVMLESFGYIEGLQ
jgi:hypothetical protein